MILDRLKAFHRSMVAVGLTRVAFDVEIGGERLDVVLLVEQTPFLLYVGKGGRWLQVPVLAGYSINPVLPHQDYSRLLEFTGNRAAGRGMFRTGQFFFDLNSKIPDAAENRMILRPYMAAQLFPHVTEPDKCYFRGFQENTGGTAVSAQNLEKTRMLLGSEAEALCRKLNHSSIWSADSERSVRTLPELAKLRRLAGVDGAPQAPALAEAGPKSTRKGAGAKPSRAFTMVCGLPGSGKTTLAQEVARQLAGHVVLDLDVFAGPLREACSQGGGVPRAGLYAALLSVAFDALAQGLSPICVAGFENELASAGWMQELRGNLEASGVALRIVETVADLGTREARLRQRGEAVAGGRPVLPDALRGQAMVVDTAKTGRAEAAARVARYIDGGPAG